MTNAPRLTSAMKAGWAMGQLASASYVGVTMIFLMFFLTNALGISPAIAGAALIIPRLWDVIAGPVIGALSDRTNSRWGRRRPYVAAGALLLGLAFTSMFLVPDFESQWARAACFTGLYVIVCTCYSIYEVPYSAMSAELTDDYKERTTLSGYRMVAARLGIVLTVLCAPLLFGSQATLREGFVVMGATFGAFILVTGLAPFFATAQAPRINRPVTSFSVRDEWAAIASNRPFRILFGAFLLQNLAIGATATGSIYFLTAVMGASATIAGAIFAMGSLTAATFTPAWIQVARRVGKTRAYALSLAAAVATCIAPFFLSVEMFVLLFVVYFLHGIADAGTQLLPNSMVPDTVEVDEQQTGRRREGAIFGAWSFCRKLGMALGAFIVGLGLDWSGFVAGASGSVTQPDSALLGIRCLFAIMPAIFWIAALLLLRRYDLSEERFNQLKVSIHDTHHSEPARQRGNADGVEA